MQIQLPARRDPGFRLASIRVRLSAVPNPQARRSTDLLAEVAQIACRRSGRDDRSDVTPEDHHRSIEATLRLALPTSLNLGAFDG